MVGDVPSHDDIVNLAKRLKILGVTEYSDGQISFKIDLSYRDRIRTKRDLVIPEDANQGPKLTFNMPLIDNLESIRAPVSFHDNRTPEEREVDRTLFYSAS
jgi:hypothetical protein